MTTANQLGPFYVSQVPLLPLVITVAQDDGTPADLTVYGSVALRLFRPDGAEQDTTPGELAIDPADDSRVTYAWPDPPLFTQAGQWTVQLQLIGPGAVNDFAVPVYFDVLPIGA